MIKPTRGPSELVESAIVVVRGSKVLLDESLAALYGVSVKALNQAVRRNIERFPADFAFRLTLAEVQRSRSQFVTLNAEHPEITQQTPTRTERPKRGENLKYLPYAFTEQGVAMLSSVLRSPRAIQANIEIMRAFVRLRQILLGHEALARKVAALEQKYDGQFRMVFDAIRELMEPIVDPKEAIGFRVEGVEP
jgi:hypothetical protein